MPHHHVGQYSVSVWWLLTPPSRIRASRTPRHSSNEMSRVSSHLVNHKTFSSDVLIGHVLFILLLQPYISLVDKAVTKRHSLARWPIKTACVLGQQKPRPSYHRRPHMKRMAWTNTLPTLACPWTNQSPYKTFASQVMPRQHKIRCCFALFPGSQLRLPHMCSRPPCERSAPANCTSVRYHSIAGSNSSLGRQWRRRWKGTRAVAKKARKV